MELATYQDIKEELLEDWEHVTESRLHEYVESNTPVYYSSILKEWQELPSEDTDAWKDYGLEITSETTIFTLMEADLSIYYEGLVEKAFQEITEEKEAAE
jgi:hypothetical protein